MDLTHYYIRSADKEEVKKHFSFLRTHIIPEFREYYIKVYGIKKIPKLINNTVISFFYLKTFKQLEKTRKNKHYYIYLSIVNEKLINEILEINIDEVFILIEEYKDHNGFLLINPFLIFNNLLDDSMFILQEFCENFPNKIHKPNWATINFQNTFPDQILNTAKKLLQGALIDNIPASLRDPYLSQVLLRQAIELNIRKTFRVFAIEDKNGNTITINISHILEVLAEYKGSLMHIDFNGLNKIQGWCNLFVHSGFSDYLTKVKFAIDYTDSMFKSLEHLTFTEHLLDLIHHKIMVKTLKPNADLSEYKMIFIIKPNLKASGLSYI